MLEGKLGARLRRQVARVALGGGIAAVVAVTGWSSAVQAAPHEYSVTMANMSYGKIPAGVHVGDTIVWVNRDTVPHTATARDKSFDVRVQQGQSIRMTVKKAGTFAIYCIFHPGMRATLTVAA